MIAVDTSVVIAILQSEPESEAFIRQIAHNQPARMSTVSMQEAGMIMRSRRGDGGVQDLYDLLDALKIEVISFDATQTRAAIVAFGRYEKGIHPQAKLNMGDCAAYALAKTIGVPLFYKGADSSATDIAAVVVDR